MIGLSRLENEILEYDWGSHTVIAELLGRPSPSLVPQAELWLGAHPKAPSRAIVDGERVSLRELIARAPAEVLGAEVAARYGGELPFLLKVLAAERPLSIQTHPDASQAAAGYAREDRAGIARDAPARSYRDTRSKPELLYALSDFTLLRGFRRPAEILALAERLGLSARLPECALLRDSGVRDSGAEEPAVLTAFFRACMDLTRERVEAVLAPLTGGSDPAAEDAAVRRWLADLARRYPGDSGALAPLWLHLVELRPGEVLYTGPGVPHAYLHGAGIELMANSDNVLRGGLTSKHVDVPELSRILCFAPQPPHLLAPVPGASGEVRYASPAGELVLSVLEVRRDAPYGCPRGGLAVLLCTAGEGRVEAEASALTLRRGDSCLVPAAAGGYRITGEARLFRATVGRT